MAALTPQEIVRLEDGVLVLLDQRRLPAERVENRYPEWQPVVGAIQTMVVRGAPAIGVAAAYGIAVAGPPGAARRPLAACSGLAAARPTAVNLGWAVARMRDEIEAAPDAELVARLDAASSALHRLEVERCEAIGRHGAALLPPGARVLTHCNTGALATGGYGTALGVIRAAHERDPRLTVWVDETRPLLQGARLTAWELEQEAIPATLITDSMAGWLMRRGEVDAVITGADRIAAQRRRGQQDRHVRPQRAGARARRPVLRRRADVDDRRRPRRRRCHPHRASRPRGGARFERACRCPRLQSRLRRDPGRQHHRAGDRDGGPPASLPAWLTRLPP